jgi:hypothetical protein
MKSKRQSAREKRRQQQRFTRIGWGIAAIALLAILGYALWVAFRPAAGESVPIMADSSHVPDGTDPGPYNSDPPTSGRHYEQNLPVGFYDEQDLPGLGEYPQGLLVHSLEHGYVIFWYNCDLLGDQACQSLKEQIQAVMDQADNFKVIAFPWKSIDVPLVMTSWGKLQKFASFDPDQALGFVISNRNRSPEPNAP